MHAEEETRKVVALLGGPEVFTTRIKTSRDLQAALREGFPYASFEAVMEALQSNTKDLARLVGVATRTLARRKDSQTLSPIESDRLYRVARLTLLAHATLGSLEQAREWLHKSNQALGGDSPLSVLDTEIGERQVEELLHRISYGIYS